MRHAVEGGVTVILTLMILFGAIAGGVALFGAGGWVRRRKIEGDLDDAPPPRPQLTGVDNEYPERQIPRNPSDSPQPPE
jgi:hypothetical protein